MITVKQLVENLEKCDPDAVVILQKDAEGNGYSPLADTTIGMYMPDSTWSGEVYFNVKPVEETEEEINAVILGPVN